MSRSNKYSKRQPSKEFGAYLTELRDRRTDYSQADAAHKLGFSKQQLNYYEKGTRVPPDSVLISLARLYHVPTTLVLERAYWPQLILVPLIAIVDPDQLSRDLIEALEKGLQKAEREELTQYIKDILHRRPALRQR